MGERLGRRAAREVVWRRATDGKDAHAETMRQVSCVRTSLVPLVDVDRGVFASPFDTGWVRSPVTWVEKRKTWGVRDTSLHVVATADR